MSEMKETEGNPTFSNSIDRMKESFLLATASKGGSTEDLEDLLSLGADVNWRGLDAETPLLAACRRGSVDAIGLLIAYGADINVKDKTGMTPLHIAARRGDAGTVNVLLNASANVNIRTADGKTAYEVAKYNHHDDVCQRIITHRHNPSRDAQAPAPQQQAGRRVATSPSSATSASGLSNAVSHHSRSAAPINRAAHVDSRPDSKAASRMHDEKDPLSPHRPSSKAADRGTSGDEDRYSATSGENDRGGSRVAPPKSSRGHSVSLAAPTRLSSASAGASDNNLPLQPSGAIDSVHQNYIYDLQARIIQLEKQAQTMASEAEVSRIHLEESLVEGVVAAKECVTLKEKLLSASENMVQLEQELAVLRADDEALREITAVAECDKVEQYLKASLSRYENHKAMLINKMVENNTEESRLCVVCQGAEKSVVLLPCRHVCLCKGCANNEQVKDCPLCRMSIQDKIAVFM